MSSKPRKRALACRMPDDSKEKQIAVAMGKLEIVDTTKKDEVITEKVVTVVGKKIGLKGRIVPAPGKGDVTDPLWTIPKTTVKSYKTTVEIGVKEDLADVDLKQDTITYYWIDGGDGRKVQFQVKYKGREVKTEVEFNVQRPEATMTSETTRLAEDKKGITISYSKDFPSGTWLRFGRTNKSSGITWSSKVTSPKISGGDIAFVQLENLVRKRVPDEQNAKTLTRSSGGDFVLDTSFPYGSRVIKAGQAQSLDLSDSPGGKLDGNKFVSMDLQFRNYLMFKPSGDDSIWVSLRILEWHAKGSAVMTGKQKWDFDKKPPPDASEDPKSDDTTSLPLWKKNAKGLKYK